MPRTIAIGDIHGCSTALAKLIELIDPQPDDVLVPLGDFVDRGIDSKGVIEQLIFLADRCRLVPILGNHEEMMLGAREGRSDFQFWINCGGLACLGSYGSTGRIDLIPRRHFGFLESCQTYLHRRVFFPIRHAHGLQVNHLAVASHHGDAARNLAVVHKGLHELRQFLDLCRRHADIFRLGGRQVLPQRRTRQSQDDNAARPSNLSFLDIHGLPP
jgi:hypothetical protein